VRRLGRRPGAPKEPAIARPTLQIVLVRAEVDSNPAAAVHLCVNRATVGKGRPRFVEHRQDGLHDVSPRTVTNENVEAIVKTLKQVPRVLCTGQRVEDRQWRDIPSSLSRIWRAFGLKPHVADGFRLPPNALLIDKVRNWGRCMEPPRRHACAHCCEKYQIQAPRLNPPLVLLLVRVTPSGALAIPQARDQ
jgi:hypothetical protein